jgi:hypothetical protein
MTGIFNSWWEQRIIAVKSRMIKDERAPVLIQHRNYG